MEHRRKLIHITKMPIRWGDMDAYGHVNNTIYFRYMEQARVEWIEDMQVVVRPGGDGPVIIMLLSSMTNLREWDVWADALKDKYRVIRFDWPPYGLSTAIWTRDLSRAHRVAANIDVGIAWVNSWFLRDLRTPFGGSKQSGIGREGGVHSLEFYTELRNICIKL